jgi:hypothetical protein
MDRYGTQDFSEYHGYLLRSQFADGDGLATSFQESMMDEEKIAACLRRRNNLSGVVIDGIGSIMVKPHSQPDVKFLSYVFNACLRHGKAWAWLFAIHLHATPPLR